MRSIPKLAITLIALSLFVAAQDSPGRKVPSVTMAPAAITPVVRGKSTNVDLQFRVGSGFHINSNTPKAEFLIPTALKLTAPTDIVIGKITYPPGEDRSFPFAPDEKLNVYSGDFGVSVAVRPLSTVIPGKYAFHGTLRYQACDNAACYPPKTTPVDFEVKVEKAKAAPTKNPAQSPHAHR
ncbi:MAG TPA: protein-disulfide reductase DsbD domain-containing protein [Terriglobales bacterium]|nr:protein-disulfide reductase DsbD domain-containing protein [Terriglobales bacterium]